MSNTKDISLLGVTQTPNLMTRVYVLQPRPHLLSQLYEGELADGTEKSELLKNWRQIPGEESCSRPPCTNLKTLPKIAI